MIPIILYKFVLIYVAISSIIMLRSIQEAVNYIIKE